MIIFIYRFIKEERASDDENKSRKGEDVQYSRLTAMHNIFTNYLQLNSIYFMFMYV